MSSSARPSVSNAIARWRLVTPGGRYPGDDRAILGQRLTLNRAVRDTYRERWSSNTRD